MAGAASGGILRSSADDRGDGMENPERRSTEGAAALPPFWALATDAAGGKVLSYAVRGGKAGAVLGALGVASIALGAWGAYWLLSGGGVTVAGAVFAVLVPGAFLAFGAHCLDTAFWARQEYALGRDGLLARRRSLRGSGATAQIPRRAITEIAQRYSPPGPSSPAGSPGTWATFVTWRSPRGATEQLPLVGVGSPEEARWLGSILAKWSEAPLKRSFGAGLEEADPGELPELGG